MWTTSLMGVDSKKEQLRLLKVAFESGITHFDTAPYYGYGEAEKILGEFAVSKRDEITITSKYGIMPSGVARSAGIRKVARWIFNRLPATRTIIQQRRANFSQRASFSLSQAQASLEQSLRSLRTEYIDLFLLHEPTLDDAMSDEILTFLEAEVARGTIRRYGCGGKREEISKIAFSDTPTRAFLPI